MAKRKQPRKPRKIISGGQTGADRGGLDAAMELGIPHGGWCPKGRRAEDGVVPREYGLKETRSAGYPERTEQNVLWADGTVVFTHGKPTGGSKLTIELAKGHGKPVLHVDLDKLTPREAAAEVRAWMEREGVDILNIAGSREGSSAGIHREVWEIVKAAYPQ